VKTVLFVDGGYVEKISQARLDYRKLPGALLKAVGGGHLLRTYYYDCVPGQYESNKQKFLDALTYIPNFVVRYGHLEKHVGKDGEEVFTQKMTDVQLALDVLKAAQNGVERVIVMTGDMDFVPVFEAAREVMCEVVLVSGTGVTPMLAGSVDRKVTFGGVLQEECRWKNGEERIL
jgi:uncharacterized LabA/DUF88 family protein